MIADPVYGAQVADASEKSGMSMARCKELLDSGYYLETYENEETGVVGHIWHRRSRVEPPAFEYKDYNPTFQDI